MNRCCSPTRYDPDGLREKEGEKKDSKDWWEYKLAYYKHIKLRIARQGHKGWVSIDNRHPVQVLRNIHCFKFAIAGDHQFQGLPVQSKLWGFLLSILIYIYIYYIYMRIEYILYIYMYNI